MAKFATVALLAVANGVSQGLAAGLAAPGMPYTYLVYGPGSNSALTAKFKASTDADQHRYVFTEEPGTAPARFALVRLDKSTGKDIGRVKFTDRSPLFRLDPATGFVVAADEARLYGLRFPGAEAVQ